MTTTVKIDAHCSADKEVQVNIVDDTIGMNTQQVIQDGETLSVYAYDSRVIHVFEKPKGETI